MFTPKPFRLEDPAAVAALIRENSFGLLVTALPGAAPMATHLPFLFEPEAGAQGRLLGHMARANEQWRDFEALAAAAGEALVIFQGAHGYISPSWYRPGAAVPTWNYLAAHVYGLPRIIEAPDRVAALLERLVATHEAGLNPPWALDSQEPGYLEAMTRGIVAFEMPVARLEAKAKLSQNRSEADRRQVAEALEAGGHDAGKALARDMRTLALKDA